MTMPDEDWMPDEDLEPERRDPEAPPEDVLEQATSVDPALEPPRPSDDIEVNEWDAIEQATVVKLDEEYDE
jgi:hypothetical protein